MLKQIKNFLIMTLSITIMAIGVYYFKFPNNFTFGGVTGAAVVFAKITPLSASMFSTIVNMLLLVVGFFFLGKDFAIKTTYATILLSVELLVLEKLDPLTHPLSNEPMLELIFAIALPAIASALLFYVGASSGGTDVIAMIVKKYAHVENIGMALFLTDLVMIIIACFVFDIKTALYSFVGLVVKSFMIDAIIENIMLRKSIMLICDDKDVICDYITNTLEKSATYVEARGAYTGERNYIVFSTLTRAYFDYDSKKSGGVTMSHLRFGKSPIKSTYLIHQANFVACHNPSYVNKYNMVQELVDGGTFLLNCPWDMEGLEKHLPGQVKAYIADHNIKFYTIDGIKIGKEIGLGGRINTVLQSAFFKLASIIPEEEAIDLMKKAAKATYGRKGDKIVQMNYDAIDAGAKQVVEVTVPDSWKSCEDEGLFSPEVKGGREDVVDFVKNIQAKVNAQEGNSLPVSAFNDYVDGSTPSGASAYEKRGIAVDIPVWKSENCIQCNRCAYVCPHAVIRPVALTEEELANAPEGTKAIDMIGMPGMKFAIIVSALDCTGCGSCANVCPGKKGEKALVMENMEANVASQEVFDFGREIPVKPEVIAKFKPETVKGSQFKQPLLEFSGACAGCGETPYAKLITQLFGDRMYIANATGCSSIWGNSSPSTPYTVTPEGKGPAWANSLFEDNAEFGYGMLLAQKAIRKRMKAQVETILASDAECATAEVKAACQEYLDTFNCGASNGDAADKLVAALEGVDCDVCRDIINNKDFLAKKSQWIFGGDGWAYDIGFGGVDHVLASGEDINVMVFDTEVYSNTGGQSSKATKTGATAQFAAGGKETKKKDLAGIAMSYGYVYVAQIAMGADFNQTVKASVEAEAYPRPSLIIAYAPCINHGIKKGMSKAQTEEALAVECGYWNNFRFNPAAEGAKFSLDSKEPKQEGYQAFLDGEVRYNALKRANPEKAEKLFAKNEAEAMERYDYLKKLVALYGAEE